MDENNRFFKQSLFHIERDNQQITTISPLSKVLPEQLHMVDYLLQFVDLVTFTLQQEDTAGVIYYCPIPVGKIEYAQLFNQFSSIDSTASTLKSLILKTLAWKELNKPIVSIFTENCTDIPLATMLWAGYRIASQKLKFGFPESKYGLFTGFGSTVYLPSLIGNSATLNLLTQGKFMNSEEAYKQGLIDEVTQQQDEGILLAKKWILKNPLLIPDKETKQQDQLSPEAILNVQRKARGLYPGTNAVIELLKKRASSTPIQAMDQEVTLYLEVLNRPEPLHMIRTLYYGVQDAQSPSRIGLLNNYTLNKIGILGAGMMGSGIAYEAARAGIEVVLKDVTIIQAERGKAYSTQLCEKLLDLGILSQSQQEQLLSRIKPTEKVGDLNGSDCIIEAVFEDFFLKAAVTQESLPYLADNGFFASNTTSLPITELAKAAHNSKSFIGMHFFSPVDRMPLVEIICGKETDEITLQKALTTALKLNKIPIIVHDGPGFFTSRIFFNYLLEGITMVLEGISPLLIEEEAVAAGFAVGPLAVLDEISLELMLHVYDQFPALHASQQRAYSYLKKMVDQGRKGKKSGVGFYDYHIESKQKTIWKNPMIPLSENTLTPSIIRKRLLHVMALDSYRCLEGGIIDRPIDGDIGSILGVGYASYTGGVFGHIDLTTLPIFVAECEAFHTYGEQWNVPESLKELANRNFKFYTGFLSNWH